MWTRAPHIPERTLGIVEGLQNLAEDERDQRMLLSQASLNEHGWLGFSSTSEQPRSQQQVAQCVTIARMPVLAVHYRSRIVAAPVEAAPDQPGTQGVVPGVPVHELPSGDTSPGSWGPRIADEDLDLVILRLSPARGMRIQGRRQSYAEHSQQPLTEGLESASNSLFFCLQSRWLIGEGPRGRARKRGGRGWQRWPTSARARPKLGLRCHLARVWRPGATDY